MDPDTKIPHDREHSLEDDVLKGDIVIGAIAGEEARQATAQEHSLSFIEAVKLYVRQMMDRRSPRYFFRSFELPAFSRAA